MVEKFSGKVEKASDLTITEFASFIRQEIALFVEGRTKNCMECNHFDTTSEICQIAGKTPPIHVACRGCELFEQMIPF